MDNDFAIDHGVVRWQRRRGGADRGELFVEIEPVAAIGRHLAAAQMELRPVAVETA